MHLRSFRVEGFKNFRREIALEDLGPVNILHGDNNIGKSNLLEAIGLFFDLLAWMRSQSSRVKTMDISARAMNDRGYPVREIFNWHKPTSLRLRAAIAVTMSELEQHGVEPPFAFEQVEIEHKATIIGDSVRVETRFDFDDSTVADHSNLLAPDQHSTFLTQLSWFLTQAQQTSTGGSIPRCVLLGVERSLRPFAGASSPSVGSSSRGLIPRDLCLAFYDAKESTKTELHRPWRNVESVLGRFTSLTGEGSFVPVYNRQEAVADLVFETPTGQRIPAHLLGSGVQQIVNLLGRLLMTGASILAVEEPELNLKYTLQLQLAEALRSLLSGPDGPSQLFLTSHSPAFEGNEGFYWMHATSDGPVIERRPSAQARDITSDSMTAAPPGARGNPSYVSSDGIVQIPPDIRERLGIASGGGVVFLERRDTGHFEILNDEQFFQLFSDKGERSDDSE